MAREEELKISVWPQIRKKAADHGAPTDARDWDEARTERAWKVACRLFRAAKADDQPETGREVMQPGRRRGRTEEAGAGASDQHADDNPTAVSPLAALYMTKTRQLIRLCWEKQHPGKPIFEARPDPILVAIDQMISHLSAKENWLITPEGIAVVYNGFATNQLGDVDVLKKFYRIALRSYLKTFDEEAPEDQFPLELTA
jgi:hypothetical protein